MDQSDQTKTYTDLQRFYKLDQDYIKTLSEWLAMLMSVAKLTKTHPHVMKNISLAGSSIEGAALSRLFEESKDFESGVNQEMELDAEIVACEVLPSGN